MVSSLAAKFEAVAKCNGVNVHNSSNLKDIARYISDIAKDIHTRQTIWAPPEISDGRELMQAVRSLGVACIEQDIRSRVRQAPIGITGANGGIAESGSLVLNCSMENTRLVTSLTKIYIAVLSLENLVATLEDAVSLWNIGAGRGGRAAQWEFISAPSRTSSLEQIRTTGVLGPNRLHVILV